MGVCSCVNVAALNAGTRVPFRGVCVYLPIAARFIKKNSWAVAITTMIDPEAARIANLCPIVHVGARKTDYAETLFSSPFEIAPSRDPGSAPNTLAAENGLGIGRCLYFFAGRAEPFGNISLVFSHESERNHRGSASPFDSGGLFHGHIKHRMSGKGPLIQCKVFNLYNYPLADWRQAFAHFLSRHFSRPADYFLRDVGPKKTGNAFGAYDGSRGNGVRAWTFEMRFKEAHCILDAIAWSAHDSVINGPFRRMMEKVPFFDPILRAERSTFTARCLTSSGSIHHTAIAEDWIHGYLKI
jgi:hypothetical protein